MIARTPITDDVVIIAPERDERPNVYEGAPCPFCPGAEPETPPEIGRDGDPWRIRVFPNKYPAAKHHEIIVESNRHDDAFDRLAPEHARRVIELTIERYDALRRDAAYVCIFKNHGRLAGASIPHLHSQIAATSFVPLRIERESESFARAARCPLCNLDDHPLIEETEHFRWIAPQGSRMAYQQWIVPKLHANEVSDPGELASILQTSARAMSPIGDSFNWAFVNFPRQPHGHWYVELFPRLTMLAGFELGAGTFINTVDPEEAARVLRFSE